MRNTLAVVDWQDVGPRVFAYLREEVPGRKTLRGIGEDCVTALGLTVDPKRLLDWLSARASREKWSAIKRTLGTGGGPPVLTGAGAQKSSPLPAGLTLLEYDRRQQIAEDKARCPVCALSPELREQVAECKRSGMNSTRIIAALAKVYQITIAPSDYVRHINRRHET